MDIHCYANPISTNINQYLSMNILAIGAHPDDVEFGAAPLLIKELKKGNQAKIVVCSLGEAGTSGTPQGRKKEAMDAAKVVGAEIEFLNLGGDCHIEYNPQNGFKIAAILRKYKPNIVLAPSLMENQHPDHGRTGHGHHKRRREDGPENTDTLQTPLNAELAIGQFDLIKSGFVAPNAGLSGLFNLAGTTISNGHNVQSKGNITAEKLQII